MKTWNPLVKSSDTIKVANLPEAEIWTNDLYTVYVRRNQSTSQDNVFVAWLSIKRNNLDACRDWRHFQYIKNQLVGKENEGCEIFPAESRLVDGSNQYHLWVFENPDHQFPFGFNSGRIITRTPLEKGKQREFPPNMVPEDIHECEIRVNEQLLKNMVQK